MILSVPANSVLFQLRPSIASSLRLRLSSEVRNIARRRKILCKAELIHDAPFAVALGASVISSLVLPNKPGGAHDEDEGEDGDGAMDSTDSRLAVMAIISVIPYFNWLGWVFAWMDTGKQRYLVYSLVYLAPYLRTNLSLSPEESWLPIASILICILHVQLETSIKNGDFEGFKFPLMKSNTKSRRASMTPLFFPVLSVLPRHDPLRSSQLCTISLRPSIASSLRLRLSSEVRNIARRRKILCKAELIHDAPFAVALGASVISSLVLPNKPGGAHDEDEGEDGDGAMDSTDSRLAVMAIISVIPYFNWLGWVFAWMDTGKQRYLVYSLVYLAPYLRTNLSLSPEESWLPIASILICILHVQLETSIKNGDFESFKFPLMKSNTKSRRASMTGHGKRNRKLPSSNGSREKLRDWGVNLNPRDEMPQLDETVDDDKLN